MYHYDGFIFIEMGMGIDIGRRTVGSPSGMSDPYRSRQGCSAVGELIQNFQPSHGFHHLNGRSVIDSNSRGIVSSVLQFLQAFQQNRCCLFFSDITNYSTHNHFLHVTGCKTCILCLIIRHICPSIHETWPILADYCVDVQ